MRGGNQQDKYQEDLALLIKFIESNCTVAQINAMFELMLNKSNNKELQSYFNSNQAHFQNNPKIFADLTTTTPQLLQFLSTYNCSQNTKEKIREYLIKIGKSKLSEMDPT